MLLGTQHRVLGITVPVASVTACCSISISSCLSASLLFNSFSTSLDSYGVRIKCLSCMRLCRHCCEEFGYCRDSNACQADSGQQLLRMTAVSSTECPSRPQKRITFATFEFFTAMQLRIASFWRIAPLYWLIISQRFGAPYWFTNVGSQFICETA